jgi:malonate transporter and related proteins
MPTILSALLPIFALIVLGYCLKRTSAFPDSLWAGVELLIYWVLLPGLLVVKLGNTDLSQFDIMPMAGAMAGATALVAISLVGIRKAVGIAGPVYTSILQGAIRQNSFIGLAAAAPLYGASGQALAAVGIAAVIPLVNVISMWSLARLGPGGPPSVWVILKRLGKSPIIIGCTCGIGANLAGTGIHDLAAAALDLLSRGALPLGLLAVGAGLDFAAIRRGSIPLLLSNSSKLIAIPVLTAWFCQLQNVDPTTTGVAILFSALPTSASAYVMARQFGGDNELMAAILTSQVLMAAVTIPVMLVLFG